MAKINTGTITADGSGNWSSNAVALTGGSKRVYMRVNGAQILYRDFSVNANISYPESGATVPNPVTVTGTGGTAGATVELWDTPQSGANLIADTTARAVGSTAPDIWYTGYSVIPTVTLNYATAPDGSNEASRIQYTTTGNPIFKPRTSTGGGIKFTVTANTQYTMSWWVKDIGITATTPSFRLRYTPYIGAAAQTEVMDGGHWSEISAAAGAWVRLSYTFTTAASVDGAEFNFLANTVASGNIDVLAWGAKAELGSSATGTYL